MIAIFILLLAGLITWAFFRFVDLVNGIIHRSQRDGLFKDLLK